jgi:hypothetical protein
MSATSERRDQWLVPIQGVFRDHLEEETFRPPGPFSIRLEPGLEWRSKTEADQQLIAEWYQSWSEHLGSLTRDTAEGADSVLSAEGQEGMTSEMVASFVLALSLHTRVRILSQRLHFRYEGSDRPYHEGDPPARTIRLRDWPEEEPITQVTRLAVADTFTRIRALRQDPQTGVAWALGAYRSAISHHDFVDAVAILACASLEALSAEDGAKPVIERVERFASTEDAADRPNEPLQASTALRARQRCGGHA